MFDVLRIFKEWYCYPFLTGKLPDMDAPNKKAKTRQVGKKVWLAMLVNHMQHGYVVACADDGSRLPCETPRWNLLRISKWFVTLSWRQSRLFDNHFGFQVCVM